MRRGKPAQQQKQQLPFMPLDRKVLAKARSGEERGWMGELWRSEVKYRRQDAGGNLMQWQQKADTADKSNECYTMTAHQR